MKGWVATYSNRPMPAHVAADCGSRCSTAELPAGVEPPVEIAEDAGRMFPESAAAERPRSATFPNA